MIEGKKTPKTSQTEKTSSESYESNLNPVTTQWPVYNLCAIGNKVSAGTEDCRNLLSDKRRSRNGQPDNFAVP